MSPGLVQDGTQCGNQSVSFRYHLVDAPWFQSYYIHTVNPPCITISLCFFSSCVSSKNAFPSQTRLLISSPNLSVIMD